MIELLLTALPSLCWVLARCFQLLRVPADRLARQLNVYIPHTPTICVESLAPTSIGFHWSIDIKLDENLFFVVLVNGKDVGTLSHTSVRLDQLLPNTLYSLQVLAVNAVSNYHSQSPVVYVETPETGSPLRLLVPAVAEQEPAAKPACVPQNFPYDLRPEDVGAITDASTLATYLGVFQGDLARLSADFDALSRRQQTEEASLRESMELHRKELSEGADARARKDSDIKELERRKDTLSFSKLKLFKQLKTHESHRNIHLSKLADLQLRVAKLLERRQHILNAAESERNKVFYNVEALNGDISGLRGKIHTLEDQIKTVSAQRRDLAAAASHLRLLFQQLTFALPSGASTDEVEAQPQNEAFTRDATITAAGSQLLRDIFDAKPEWEADISRELSILQGLELSWKSTFRASLSKFLSFYNSVEVARANRDVDYIPEELTEFQASIEFGGFANALSRPDRKSLFSERSNSPALSQDDVALAGNRSQVNFYENSPSLSALIPHSVNALMLALLFPKPEYQNSLLASLEPEAQEWPQKEPFSQNYADEYSQGSHPQEIQQSYLPSYNGHLGLEASLAQAIPYAQMQNFPYNEMYLSPPEGSFLQPQVSNASISSNLWLHPSNYMEGRRPYQGLSLSPRVTSENLPGNGINDGLFNSILLNPGVPQLSTSIWLDRPLGTLYSHNRTVSSGSQLWRNDARSERSFNEGFVSDFVPFSDTIPVRSSPSEDRRNDDYDIRLL